MTTWRHLAPGLYRHVPAVTTIRVGGEVIAVPVSSSAQQKGESK